MIGRGIVLITGIQAAGKSTVAQALAERLPRSVHLRGDLFRRCIVNGRADMSPDASEEAWVQLQLRYRLAAATADTYAEAGFTVIMQDVVLGEMLTWLVDRIRARPRYVVVLAPSPEVAAREAGRAKKAYGPYTIEDLDRAMHDETPRIGLWLDTSDQTVTETVNEILRQAQSL